MEMYVYYTYIYCFFLYPVVYRPQPLLRGPKFARYHVMLLAHDAVGRVVVLDGIGRMTIGEQGSAKYSPPTQTSAQV